MVNRSTVKKAKQRSVKAPSQVRRRSSKGKGSKKKSRTRSKRQSRRKSRNSVMKGGGIGDPVTIVVNANSVRINLVLYETLTRDEVILVCLASLNMISGNPGSHPQNINNNFDYTNVIEYLDADLVNANFNTPPVTQAGSNAFRAAIAAAANAVTAGTAGAAEGDAIRDAVFQTAAPALVPNTEIGQVAPHPNVLHIGFQPRGGGAAAVAGKRYWVTIIKISSDMYLIANLLFKVDGGGAMVIPTNGNAGTVVPGGSLPLTIALPNVTLN